MAAKFRHLFDIKLHDECPEGFSVIATQLTDLRKSNYYRPNDDKLNLNNIPVTITAHLETDFEEKPRKLRSPLIEPKKQQAYFLLEFGDPKKLAGAGKKDHVFNAGTVRVGLIGRLREIETEAHKRKYILQEISNEDRYQPAMLKVSFIDRKTPMFDQFAELRATLKTIEAEQQAGKDPLRIQEMKQKARGAFAPEEPGGPWAAGEKPGRGGNGYGRRRGAHDGNGHEGNGKPPHRGR